MTRADSSLSPKERSGEDKVPDGYIYHGTSQDRDLIWFDQISEQYSRTKFTTHTGTKVRNPTKFS